MIGRLFDKFIFYALIVLLIILSVSLFRNFQRVKRVNQQIKDKENEVAQIQKEGDEIAKRLQFAQSPQYMEKQLRDKLGMAKEGELVVILPPDDELRKIAPHFEEVQETSPEPNWKKWVKLFL
jgi:cell division protein FtsB